MPGGDVARRGTRFLRAHWLALLAAVSIVVLVAAVNPTTLLHAFSRISWRIALLMVPVTIASYVCRGLAWYAALRRIGAGISLVGTLAVEIAGQVMVFLPMGDLARVALARRISARRRQSGALAGTIAFQELLFMMFIACGVLPRVATQRDVGLLLLVMVIAYGAIFTVLVWQRAYDWAVRTVEHVRVLRRFDEQLRSLRPAFLQLFSPRSLLPIALADAVGAGLNILIFYLALRALGATSVSFISAAFVLGLSNVVAGLSFLPGGVGAFEGLVTVALIGNGIAPSVGAAAALLYRGYNDVMMALVGAPVAIAVRRVGGRARTPARRKRTGRRSVATPHS